MPPQVTRKIWKSAASRGGGVPQQTIDITPNTATVSDQNPFWSNDEASILYDSNRADLAGATAGTLRHIIRIFPDGSQPTAITGPLATNPVGVTASQIEPAISSSGNSVVYIENSAPGSGSLELGSVDLIELNLTTGAVKSLVANNPQGLTFTGLNHPEYGVMPGGNAAVIFAGRLSGHSNFNLFAVDTQTLVITQITSGIADDRNPTLSPYDAAERNKLVIAFDSNRADANGATTKANRDIWVIPVGVTDPPATQVTNFAVGSAHADNIQPAWSTNKVDQVQSDQQFVNGRQLIAFASTRVDTNNDGNANGINSNGTHDIYWLKADIGLDTAHAGSGWYTVLTPESVTNPALKLTTSDPNHVYDDLKPTWPQFIKTYRVAYQTNRTAYDGATNISQPLTPQATTPTDLFASTLIDLNAPTLIRFDESSGDIVSVEPRIAQPGSTVKISVKLADFETGIRDVWVQIKNPNSKYQGADGVEHKVFLFRGLNLDNSNVALRVPIEYESQRIFIGSDPKSAMVGTYATPKYLASIDDVYAFSGGAHPPTDPDPTKDPGWLQLQLASRDPVTGVSTYSANWQTPTMPTDYYLDVIAYDNAVDPFTGQTSNWKIYDNIWGFSTQAFNPQSGILFVSDHAEGQKFFGSRFGTATLVNVFQTFWGTESWLTDIDINLLPTQYQNGTTIGSLVNVCNALGAKSYGAGYAGDFFTYRFNYDPDILDGTQAENGRVDIPVTQQYDIWRIQCRGPVPDALLAQYTPHVEQQPSDATSGGTQTPRNVLVASRCVIWHAPFAGNVFQAPGTITDLATQLKLQNFVAAGGRLLVNGQDIGWALTLDGTLTNAFVSGVLQGVYRADSAGATLTRIVDSGFVPMNYGLTGAYALTAPTGGNYNPIVNDPWPHQIFTHHRYAGPPEPDGVSDYIHLDSNYLAGGTSPTNVHDYGSPSNFYPDMVGATGNTVIDYAYTGSTLAGVMHYENASTHAKVVYAPMGLEGFARDAWAPANTTNTLASKNRLAALLHNAVCWMRTGVITGAVYDTQGLTLSGVLVRLLSNGQTANTAITDANGRFIMNGVVPDNYQITASKAGYQIQKATGVWVHGGARDDINMRMTVAEKSTIKGHVSRASSTTTPVVGATVTATEVVPVGGANVTPTVVSTKTDSNGDYVLSGVPAGVKYTLTCTATGYGASVPDSYILPDANAGTVLAPATIYEPFDFTLKADQGVVTGTVVAWDANLPNNIGAPIAGAVVTATQGDLSVVATTDSNGNFSFNKTNTPPNGLDPGTWSIVATAPGYGPNTPAATVNVVSGTTPSRPDQDPIKLKTVPPGSIQGLVTGSADGKPLGGVVIEVRDQAGKLVTSNAPAGTSSTVQIDPVTNNPYNYTLDVPAGPTYVVTAVASGFSSSPASRNVTVSSQQTTKGVDFVMQPLWTFSGTPNMVSTPYDYPAPTYTAGGLLGGIGTDSAFKFATWDLGRYVYYSSAPANTFRLGRGYWLGYKTNMALSTQGVSADPTQVFEIPLNPGWNMIGCPFTFPIDWTRVSVRTASGVLDHDTAVSSGKIGVAMYTFRSNGMGGGTYALDFSLTPWVGYWVKAYEPVTLLIDPVADKRSVKLESGGRAALLQDKSGWSLNLRLTVGQAADTDNYIGVSGRAADGPDGFKMEKPPVFLSDYASLRIVHSDWGGRSGDYGVDIRSSAPGQKSWDIVAETTVANKTASITWPNVASLGRGVTLTLTDLATGAVRDMRSSGGYTWLTGDTPAPRRFRITATRTAGTQLRISGVTARTTRGSSTYSIGYTLSSPASVQIRVLSPSGAEIRTLSSGTTRAAGVNQATWDLKDARGTSVPAGVYVVEITAHADETGQTARGIGTVTVIR